MIGTASPRPAAWWGTRALGSGLPCQGRAAGSRRGGGPPHSFGALVVGLALLAPLASTRAEPPLGTAFVEVGRQHFEKYCASCHGVDARGDGPVASELKRRPADLTQIAKRRDGRFPAGHVAAVIDGRTLVAAHGGREMPVWGERLAAEIPNPDTADQVTRGRISFIVEYLETLQR